MTPILIYDGDCGFCTRSARWIERRWAAGTARALPSQGFDDARLAIMGLTRTDVAEAAWWIEPDGTARRGELAVAAALRAATGWTRLLGRALALPGVRTAARPGYSLVARNRHRLPGASPACAATNDIDR